MLTKFAARNTDEIGRKALQLAVQLPEDVGEARAVLERTAEVLEAFLIKVPRELWNRPAIAFERGPGAWVAHEAAVLWTLSCLVLLSPIAAIAARLVDCESASGWVLLAGVVVTSLVLGQLYGVLFSLGSGLAHNLLTVPPVFEFTVPTRYEVVRLVGCLVIAVALPPLANAAPWLRGLTIFGAARSPTPAGR